ncbi:hypothetical protein N0V86_007109 [Didymella sp. IMI 355093]|nr:hypothetical protein N0V86_007109 [Didymella sp. IMI 355093]
MSFLTESARKIGRYFNSSSPLTSLGKRKADCWEDSNPDKELEPDSDSITSADEPAVTKTANCYSVGYKRPQRLAKRIGTPTTVIHNQTNSLLKNATLRAIDRDIQDELEQQFREEQLHTVEPRTKKQVTSRRTKNVSIARHVTFERTTGTSKPKPAAKHSPPKTPTRKDSTHRSDFAMSQAQWSDKPNTRARELLEKNFHSSAALLEDLKEPEYACRDAEIRDGVWKMMDQIETFAKEHFSFQLKDETSLQAAFESMSKETVKIIGCVASGGSAGASGWEDLFINSNKRQALVCAIIGNVLVEQVFQHMFFGGTREQIKDVAVIQFEHRNDDGFDHNKLYTTKIRSFLANASKKGKAAASTSSLHLPTNFNTHINHIVAALLTHLKPILTMHHKTPHSLDSALKSLIPGLHPLITTAALLSLHMRLSHTTVYHFTPVFKDQPYTASTMECLNHAQMIATHPRSNGASDPISKEEQDRHSRSTLPDEERTRMHQDQGLVHITLLPGVTAYRLGGWEKPSSRREMVEFEDGCEAKGVRCRALTDAWVFCR